MRQQIQLDIKMESEFLNLYQAYQIHIHRKTYQKTKHCYFVGGQLILIHNFVSQFSTGEQNQLLPPQLYLPSFRSCLICALRVSLFLKWITTLGVNNRKRSDLLSEQARSRRADVKMQIRLTYLDGSDIGNRLFRHIHGVLIPKKKQVRNC